MPDVTGQQQLVGGAAVTAGGGEEQQQLGGGGGKAPDILRTDQVSGASHNIVPSSDR